MKNNDHIFIVAGVCSRNARKSPLYRAVSIAQCVLIHLPLKLWKRARVCGLAQEMYNCYQRILIRCTTTVGRSGLDMGHDLRTGSQGNLQVCIRTRARIADTLKLFSVRSWSTLLDADLFSAGWTAGAQWMRNNYDKQCCDECAASIPPKIRLLGCSQEFGNAPNVVCDSSLHGCGESRKVKNWV